MPKVRMLQNPPITEGLIDVRVDRCEMSRERLDRIGKILKGSYPVFREQRRFRAKLEAALGGPPSQFEAGEDDLFGGNFVQEDGLQVAQFRSDGFTLNRLAPYSGWDLVFPEAMKLWRTFVDVLEPGRVRRVAVRYINHVPLDGLRANLEDYLCAPTPIPPGLDHDMTSFLTSVVIRDPDSPSSVKITQSMEPSNDEGNLVLLFDIDASQMGDWDPLAPEIESAFGHLRGLKNKVFFSSFTESAIGRFD